MRFIRLYVIKNVLVRQRDRKVVLGCIRPSKGNLDANTGFKLGTHTPSQMLAECD